jgi:hypothetical protein
MGCLSLGINLAISSVKLMKSNRMLVWLALAQIVVCGIQLLHRATSRRRTVQERREVEEALAVLESEGGIAPPANAGITPH